jgi:ribonuclease-3 family protein
MDINTINIVTLAYLGDSIYEVYIRETLIKKGIAKVEDLTKEAIKYVSAKGQATILKDFIDKNYFTEEERAPVL